MRTPLASALVLLLCGSAGGCADGRAPGAEAPLSIPAGPDPVVLRVARGGGVMVATAFPAMDRPLWRSSGRVPPLRAVIAFGAEDGYLAAVDTGGTPVRIDLRVGTVGTDLRDSVRDVASFDGAASYVRLTSGALARVTPSGSDWRMAPALPTDALLPQGDNSLIVAGVRADRVLLWRVRPPTAEVADSASFAVDGEAEVLRRQLVATALTVGDRVLLGAGEMVLGVRGRDLQRVLAVDVGDPVRALAATPSGDRVFVALEDDRTLRIVDRFQEDVTGKIRLPSPVSALRMDPLGRLLLARGPGDSVYVVDVGTEQVQGVVRTPWREDLPQLFPDGSVATVADGDVQLRNPGSLRVVRTIAGGAADLWYLLRWNGFRPRAKGLDRPVEFQLGGARDSTAATEPPGDSAATTDRGRGAPRDSGGARPPDTLQTRVRRETRP